MFNLNCKKNGFEKLFGEESRSSGNAGFHINHLLRQDWYANPKSDDCITHVVWQQSLGGWYHWRSIWIKWTTEGDWMEKAFQVGKVLFNKVLVESCQDPARCCQYLNFGLNWTKGVKAKHCWALSTNFLFSFQYKTDTKQNMVFSVALLNWRKNSNFFILPNFDFLNPLD